MPPTQHGKLRPAVLALLRAAGIPLALAPLARGTHVPVVGEGSPPDPRIKPRRRVGGWGDGGRRAAKLSSAPALLILACAACAPGGAHAPEQPTDPGCACPEPIALPACSPDSEGGEAVLVTAACRESACPGCKIVVAEIDGGDYFILLDIPPCGEEGGRSCCALQPGERVRIEDPAQFDRFALSREDPPTPPSHLCVSTPK